MTFMSRDSQEQVGWNINHLILELPRWNKAAVKIEFVTLVPSVLNLEVGEEMQLNVKITPADANPGDVVLSYYDTKIIDISSDAVVKGKALGQTEIIAHTRDKSIEARAEVYVGSDLDKIGIVLDNAKVLLNP
jgi:uncharacterized protein YjdB